MNNIHKALIEYKTIEAAEKSYNCMNCVDMDNTIIKVNYSKYKTIDLKKSNRNINSINYNEIFIVPPEFHRFLDNYVPPITKLTESLEIKIQDIGDQEVFNVYLDIEQEAKPIKINFKKEEQEDGTTTVLFNLRYDSVKNSIKTLLKTHNKKVGNHKISVQFN